MKIPKQQYTTEFKELAVKRVKGQMYMKMRTVGYPPTLVRMINETSCGLTLS